MPLLPLEVPLCFLSLLLAQSPMPVPAKRHVPEDPEAAYLDELRTIANWYGYDNTLVDTWLADGFSTDEIEEFPVLRGVVMSQ